MMLSENTGNVNSLLECTVWTCVLKNDLLLADDPGHTGSSLSSAGAREGR